MPSIGYDGSVDTSCFFVKPSYFEVDLPRTASPRYSVSVWAKIDWANHTQFASLVSRRSDVPRIFGYNIFAYNPGDGSNVWLAYQAPDVPNSGNPWTTIGYSQPADTAWHHVAMTYDGATLILYVDGIERGRTATTYAYDESDPINVAAAMGFGALTYDFPGSLDGILVFNRAITASEVLALAEQ